MKLLIIAGLTLVSLGVVTVAARADTIVFTEQSSTTLTATLNGVSFGSVAANPDGNPDRWTWVASDGSTVSLNSPYISYFPPGWADESGTYNTIREIPSNGGAADGIHLYIDSDLQPDSQSYSPAGFQSNADSSILSGYLTLTGANGGATTYDVQFVDLGDAAQTNTVPDGGATLALLGGVFLGLVSLRRRSVK